MEKYSLEKELHRSFVVRLVVDYIIIDTTENKLDGGEDTKKDIKTMIFQTYKNRQSKGGFSL